MLEMLLFIKLHLTDIEVADDRALFIEQMNERINSKTLGKLKDKYLRKFPNDDYVLVEELKSVTKQRNSFMHSLWIIIALGKNKREAHSLGRKLIKDYLKRADELFEKVLSMPEGSSS
ncbi:MAG: hypothetical protein ABIO57_04185 [Candidatus Paceibacterota bacterium]